VDGLSEKTWRDRLLTGIVADVGANRAYAKFRIIDAEGVEYLRVDRSGPNGAVRVVADSALQSKEDRFFFQEAIKLAEGQIYVSP
ncbi:hypothetical protein ABTM77_20945, partial [Acinetobacter baumannii]